ncbi:MAG: hypothetical protein OEO19_06875 [Gammaproteobacteria bacterium]|nr:hypothetical protein [Gammaproteobacteria bacterium]MDH3446662.1 hypothetical protein [Gammaproteobacteria bacterium]
MKYFGLVVVAAILYVLLDFAIDVRPPQVHSSYQFRLRDLVVDQARILRQDNLSILVIRRSPALISGLERATAHLQDPESRRSRQPGFAENALRSRHPELFVSYAIGTDLGCPLRVDGFELVEICGRARYDFAGRALRSDGEFQNLGIPDYNFSDDFNTLTIRP